MRYKAQTQILFTIEQRKHVKCLKFKMYHFEKHIINMCKKVVLKGYTCRNTPVSMHKGGA